LQFVCLSSPSDMSSGEAERRSLTRSLIALRNRLQLNYSSHHVDAAVARIDFSILKPSEAYDVCSRYIEDALIPSDSSPLQASHAPSPVVSSKKASRSPSPPLYFLENKNEYFYNKNWILDPSLGHPARMKGANHQVDFAP
jgi:hypothetical protein